MAAVLLIAAEPDPVIPRLRDKITINLRYTKAQDAPVLQRRFGGVANGRAGVFLCLLIIKSTAIEVDSPVD
jgi:hypothetical protein